MVRNHGLMALNSEDFEGYENALPFGPLSYLDQIGLMNIHLKGAIAATKTQLTLTAPSTGTTEEPVTVSAIITTEDVEPVEGVYVDFYAGGIVFGSGRTNSEGEASSSWLPEMAGDIQFKAGYLGSTDYGDCESSIEITSVTTPEPDEPDEPDEPVEPAKPDYTMYYIVAAVIIIAVAIFFYQKRT